MAPPTSEGRHDAALGGLAYVPLSTTGAELLFEVFSRRYERDAVIVTGNPPFDEWPSVFAGRSVSRGRCSTAPRTTSTSSS